MREEFEEIKKLYSDAAERSRKAFRNPGRMIKAQGYPANSRKSEEEHVASAQSHLKKESNMSTEGKHIPWIDANTWIPMEVGAYPSVIPDNEGDEVSYIVVERDQVGRPFKSESKHPHLIAPICFPPSFHGCDDAKTWARENGGSQFEAGSTLRYERATADQIAFLMKATPGTLVVGEAPWTGIDTLLELLEPAVDGSAFLLESGSPSVPGGKVGKSSGYAILANGSAFFTYDRYAEYVKSSVLNLGFLKQAIQTRSGDVVVKRRIGWIEEWASRETVNEITGLLNPDDVFVVE